MAQAIHHFEPCGVLVVLSLGWDWSNIGGLALPFRQIFTRQGTHPHIAPNSTGWRHLIRATAGVLYYDPKRRARRTARKDAWLAPSPTIRLILVNLIVGGSAPICSHLSLRLSGRPDATFQKCKWGSADNDWGAT